tara:strand:+ start:228 stop:419 length:192 start_codon:yes stop_codon:yes gene_type:complete
MSEINYTYKKLADHEDLITGKTVETKVILRKEDNAYIPFDEANTDYQEYLAWIAEGNTAEAAD